MDRGVLTDEMVLGQRLGGSEKGSGGAQLNRNRFLPVIGSSGSKGR